MKSQGAQHRVLLSGWEPMVMFSALQAQLGLQLESVTMPREVLVVTAIEMPTQN